MWNKGLESLPLSLYRRRAWCNIIFSAPVLQLLLSLLTWARNNTGSLQFNSKQLYVYGTEQLCKFGTLLKVHPLQRFKLKAKIFNFLQNHICSKIHPSFTVSFAQQYNTDPYFKPVLWIRIRIRIRIRRTKKTQKNRKQLINFIFCSAGCSLWRAEGFFWNWTSFMEA